MHPDAIADALAAIAPRAQPCPSPLLPSEPPLDPNAPRRRGRPPKKLDADFYAARALIAPDEASKGQTPPQRPPRKPRRVFRAVPHAMDGAPLDIAAVKAVIQPRPPTVHRAWPIARPGPPEPPRLSAHELKQIVDIYIERYGPILSLDEAASVAKLSKSTLRRYVCEGCFTNCVYRGRPLRFLTQRFIEEVLV